MTVCIRFYRDRFHLPRIQATPGYAEVGHYLENDIQDAVTASEILAILQQPEPAEREIVGNSYIVILGNNEVNLKCLFDETLKSHSLPYYEFRNLVASWKKFLENEGMLSFVPHS